VSLALCASGDGLTVGWEKAGVSSGLQYIDVGEYIRQSAICCIESNLLDKHIMGSVAPTFNFPGRMESAGKTCCILFAVMFK